jgi:hypothetical protein
MYHLLLESVLLEFRVQVDFATHSHSAKTSWCRATPPPLLGPMTRPFPFLSFWQKIALFLFGHPLWQEHRSVTCNAIAHWFKSYRTHNLTLMSPSRLPQPGGPGSCIYTPQEQGGPVIPPGIGFPFCRLLWLAGLHWMYSSLPPQFDHC